MGPQIATSSTAASPKRIQSGYFVGFHSLAIRFASAN